MKNLLLFLTIVFSNSTWANTSSVSVFMGNKFITNPENCSSEYRNQPNFYILDDTNSTNNNIENIYQRAGSNSLILGQIPLGSFVFVHPNHKKYTLQKNKKLFIQIAKKSETNSNIKQSLTNGFKGYCSSDRLDSLDNWAIHITQSYSLGFLNEPTNFLDKKLLTIHKQDHQYVVEKCCTRGKCRDYTVFNVISAGQIIGHIAFNPAESSFIKKYKPIKILTGTAVKTPAPTETKKAAVAQNTKKEVQAVDTNRKPEDVQISAGAENVVCTKKDPLNIWNEDLSKRLSTADRFSSIKVFQGWGESIKDKSINDKNYSFIKVQLENDQIGWAATSYIKAKGDCAGYNEFIAKGEADKRISEEANNCCRFPTSKKPSRHYTSGGRQFNAARGSRKHAAADLHRPKGENVLAVTGGSVLRKYAFKRGTWAVEVKLDNGLQALYGEVSKSSAKALRDGKRFNKGDIIGQIGGLRMLHFELYSGKSNGVMASRYYSLPYRRRKDLINPIPYLQKWEKTTF